jgi:cellulose synthase/poly-beta-1,6-N-acetylglucosamine synthase-like glycosyltransferase
MTAVTFPTCPTEKFVDPELPFVSVIIPVRNDARRLAVCLRSLSELDYAADRMEVIVVDNGSRDDSAEVARAAGAKVLLHPDLRVGALRNRGVEAARGEILALVDSDHEVPKGWLRAGVNDLVADPDLHMVGAPYLPPPQGTWVQRIWAVHRLRHAERGEVVWLASGNLFLRKRDFNRIGGFDETLVAAEDVDLCVRLKAAQGRIVSDMRLANIHHGEPPTLWQFFRKELWRGSSGIRAFLAHGMPLHELPSLAFPIYHLLALTLLVATAFAVALGASWLWLVVVLGLLVLPAALLGLKTSWQARRPLAMPQLAVLYFTYGLARTAALFKR